MSVKSFKDLSLDELDDMIQQRRNGSLHRSKHMMRSSSKDSLFKDSLPFINMPKIDIARPDVKNPPIYSSSLQQALKEMQRTNITLEHEICELKEQVGNISRQEGEGG